MPRFLVLLFPLSREAPLPTGSAGVTGQIEAARPRAVRSYAGAQPSIDSAVYHARRRAAMEKIPDGMIALHSVSGLKRWDESGFHQDASFYAFTGLTNARNA